jgi:hypothetical protein
MTDRLELRPQTDVILMSSSVVEMEMVRVEAEEAEVDADVDEVVEPNLSAEKRHSDAPCNSHNPSIYSQKPSHGPFRA